MKQLKQSKRTKKKNFLILLVTLAACTLGNASTGKGVITAGEGVITAPQKF